MLNIKLYSDTAYKRPTGGFLPEVPHGFTRSTSRRAQIIVTVPAILELPISVEDEDKTKERTTESEIEGDDDDYNIVFLKLQKVTTKPLIDPNIKHNDK